MSTFKKMQKTFILWVWLFSSARIQPSLWLISLINCIPSISARKQSMASAMFGNYHIAILVLQLGNWGTDQGWICDQGQPPKKPFQRFWAAWGQMCSFPAAQAHWPCPSGEKLLTAQSCSGHVASAIMSCLQGERTRGVNVNWWQKSTLLRRRAACLQQASGRCCWSNGRQAVVPSNKLALCGCHHLSISDRNPILQFLIGGIQRSRI